METLIKSMIVKDQNNVNCDFNIDIIDKNMVQNAL